MNRPVVIYAIFYASVLVTVGSLAWVSQRAIALDRRDAAAQRQSDLEESVRLALWRMDSALGPIVAQENARPWFEYDSYYNPTLAFAADFSPIAPSDIQLPSPLLDNRSPLVKLYFQVDDAGRVSSPQVPGPHQPPARADPPRNEQLALARQNLAVMMALAEPDVFFDNTRSPAPVRDAVNIEPASQPAAGTLSLQRADAGSRRALDADAPRAATAPPNPNAPQIALNDAVQQEQLTEVYGLKKSGRDRNAPEQQELRGNTEWQFRQRINEQSKDVANFNRYQGDYGQQAAQVAQAPQAPQEPRDDKAADRFEGKGVVASAAPARPAAKAEAEAAADALVREASFGVTPLPPSVDARPEVREGPMEARWIGGELILLRRVRVDGRAIVQGVWLDWPAVRDWLLEQVRYDLLPAADLAPAAADTPEPATGYSFSSSSQPMQATRLLASAPIRLVESTRPAGKIVSLEPLSPATFKSLSIAWCAALAALLAMYLLLRGTLALSERRAAFVSAVTHELRTPLTTFKMYTQMLAEGMVADEPTRQRYLSTLRVEADRLGHLVENVLAYARLERNRLTGRFETLAAAELVERIGERLTQRAEQAGMQLVIHFDPGADEAELSTDPAVVEQVLFNLVDNACKYAAHADDKRVHVHVTATAAHVRCSVIDHGPGVCADAKPTLFQPFTKSAQRAATSAAGVGLGLALCRRLARRLGGDLTHESARSGGCRFELTLPRG